MKFSSARSISIPSLLASIVVGSGCSSTPKNEHPSDFAMNRLRDDDAWERKRRSQLDAIFDHVVDTGHSPEAMEWMHVYVLAQVADRQDRESLGGDLDRLDARLAQFRREHTNESAEFGNELARLRDEMKGLRELYATPLAAAVRTPDLKAADVKLNEPKTPELKQP